MADEHVKDAVKTTEINLLTAEVRQLCERIADYETDHRRVVAGECAPDERHCSCVPHLRRALTAALAREEEAVRFGLVGGRAHMFDDTNDAVARWRAAHPLTTPKPAAE